MTFHKNNKCDDSSAFEPKKRIKKTMNTRKEAKHYSHHVNNKTFYKKPWAK